MLAGACGGGHGERVTVIGDSLTVRATTQIRAAFRGDRISINGENGKRADELVAALKHHLPADVVIVNVGTNDAIQARTHPDWRSGFDEIVSLVENVPCVVFATVSTIVGSAEHSTVAAQINAEIRNLARSRSNVRVVDWNAAVHGPDAKNYLDFDGIHETPAGAEWFADQYARAIRSCTTTAA